MKKPDIGSLKREKAIAFINLDYAIEEMVDEYEQEEIIDYFKACETSSLQIAQDELADSSYTWEQLKIMRIKFLSVFGN